MIKNTKRDMLGHLAYSIVGKDDEWFEVSTINLPARRIESPMTRWRDDWWLPPFPNETMVWRCKESGEREGDILHCQGHRKAESAIKRHQFLCERIEKIGRRALNGRMFQTTKLNEDRRPKGLIKDIANRTKGLIL